MACKISSLHVHLTMDSVKLLQAFNPTDQNKTNWLHSITSAIMYLQNNPWHTGSEINTSFYTKIRTVARCRRKTTTFNWSSVAFTNMPGVACVSRVQWWRVYVWPHWSSIAVDWSCLFSPCSLSSEGIMNSTRGSEIALLFTHAQSHTHTLSFITLAGKERGERRV